ncbi:MAG: glucokinase [Maricaulaceae bacterium]|jgi:glucokinase
MKYSAIIADIGADRCRVMSMKERSGGGRSLFGYYKEYETADFESVEEFLDLYMREIDQIDRPPILCLAVDCPVTGDTMSLITTGWTFSRSDLQSRYGFDEVLFVNECTAIAASIEWLEPADFRPIGKVARDTRIPDRTGRFVVVSPGATLGVAGVDIQDGDITLIASEGGHVPFGPTDDFEIDILKQLRSRYQRVSQETVLSERGLVSLYTAIAELGGETVSDLAPLEVMLYATTKADPTCAKALEKFYECLGSFAGDVALSLLAVDGVFLAGDLVSKAQGMSSRGFRERFESKGMRTGMMRQIPTFAISQRGAVLVGLSRVVSDHIAHSVTERIDRALTTENVFRIVGEMSQALCVLDADLDIVATTGRVFKLAGIPDELWRPGMPFEGCLRHMAESGWLGKTDTEAVVNQQLGAMRAGKDYVHERSVVGGRVFRDIGRPRPEGGFVIASLDVTDDVYRTRELEKVAAQLRKAKTKADESVRAKSEFLANMSHEIRTPMNGVLGMAEILAGTELDDKQHDMLDVIMKSGNSLLAIINDILDLSKIEAGKLRLRKDHFDLRTTIEDVAMMFAGPLEEKGLEMLVRYNPDLPEEVIGDQGRVRQVVTNLVGNAVKFTDKGHVLIDVDGQPVAGGVDFTISIADTGCGIPQDKLEAIFELFEQVDGSSTRKHEGTGLGLNISRRLTDLMGGTISVESKTDEGSTFTVSVFLPAEHDARLTPALHGKVDLAGRRVLIVDDILVNRNILDEQCRSWGMIPTLAEGGVAALAAIAEADRVGDTFDAAIFDYQMPDMHGGVLAERVRAMDAHAGMPLILLSSVSHMDMASERALELFDATLTKPARAQALRDQIETVLLASGRATPLPPESEDQAAEPQASGVPASKPPAFEPATPAPAAEVPAEVPSELTPALEPSGDTPSPVEAAAEDAPHVEFHEVDAEMDIEPVEAPAPEPQPEPAPEPAGNEPANAAEADIEFVAVEEEPEEAAPAQAAPEPAPEPAPETAPKPPTEKVAAPSPRPAKTAAVAAADDEDDEYLGERVRVLLAEDNPVNVKVTLAMLDSDLFDVTVAEDGLAAVEAYQICRPDIVLMDVSMPRLDGLGAATRIRTLQDKDGRRAPIIGVTAHVMPEDRQRCIEAGMDGHLGKPTTRDALVSAIQEYLDIYKADAGAEQQRA